VFFATSQWYLSEVSTKADPVKFRAQATGLLFFLTLPPVELYLDDVFREKGGTFL